MSLVVGQNSLCVSQRQANDFLQLVFLIFEMEGMTKPLMTASAENSKFCFPETHNVTQDRKPRFHQKIRQLLSHTT